MSFSITESVETQLWLEKTCTVNFNYSSKSFFTKYFSTKYIGETYADGGIEK